MRDPLAILAISAAIIVLLVGMALIQPPRPINLTIVATEQARQVRP